MPPGPHDLKITVTSGVTMPLSFEPTASSNSHHSIFQLMILLRLLVLFLYLPWKAVLLVVTKLYWAGTIVEKYGIT